MACRIARGQTRRVGFRKVRCLGVVIVDGKPVVVLLMVVVAVNVGVQRRSLADCRYQGHAEHDRDDATHSPSV
jgi:hypothetical protein